MWFLLGILIFITAIVILQETRYALIDRRMTNPLWLFVTAAVLGVLILRSGRGRGGNSRSQLALGTLSNSFYEPRRRALLDGGAVLGGVSGGLWWGASTWAMLWRGMLRGSTNRGLLSFQTSVVIGILTGGVIGAVLGLYAGDLWERSHRKRRLRLARPSPTALP
jgi:hypothetical protein